MVIARYGTGVWVYTAYAFYRELPLGVPGAYRLFANLLSLKKNPDFHARGPNGTNAGPDSAAVQKSLLSPLP
jgi:hypothetical protein